MESVMHFECDHTFCYLFGSFYFLVKVVSFYLNFISDDVINVGDLFDML